MNNQGETTQPQAQYIQPPTFVAPLSQQSQHAIQTRGNPSTLNLDDIFGDCFFTPEGDQIFLSENEVPIQASGETVISSNASKPILQNGTEQYVPVPNAGGIETTGLNVAGPVRATTMGPVNDNGQERKIVPMIAPPQQKHHLQYAIVSAADKKSTAAAPTSAAHGTMRDRKMSDQQKSERRERNREHAKRSRIRKKFLLESLQQSVSLLKEENDKLKSSIRSHLGDKEADELLKKENLANVAASESSNTLIATNSKDANKVLDDPDFSFIKALQTAQQNFVVTDPSLPDNPIVYATQGFLNLTGYSLDQVLGRNCRFLQGPETDPKAVEKIRRSIEEGTDMSVCLLNYRVDGTTFWNQFFIAALRDAAGNITNYVGVQCKVSDQYAANVCKRQEEEFARQEAEAAADFGDDFNDASSSHADVKLEDDHGMNMNFHNMDASGGVTSSAFQ
mmetsp:Transcript_3952/g.7601  ORF Transcript_3952/g.7601 Transcript_3952/m.7601 type:complete len:450 (+) Transcript_3952:468-1817(+)|eukprot:CAMPEP_0176493390 /NCGR_PEP_ID=MMETSP0200_2-20121128/9525_1 /TAXON_ID=947934 /ORGANISM="Chaetoceros sp., Strain GSL56" /LENGTH=449 /DNA_ID=CAMNT_0017891053 /DNA_START=371 /DNA_END=1720 /DNA_ORIENTATION=+